MKFKEFKNLLQENFEKLTQNKDYIFEVELDKDEFWNLYLDSFPDGTNEIFRERREYDCSCCRQFIKNIGNVVVIDNNKIKTIWDFETGDSKYQHVINALSNFVKSHVISNIYFNKFNQVGTDKNLEDFGDGFIKEWDHLYLTLPDKFVARGYRSIPTIQGQYRDTKNVFKRSLDEITVDSVLTVLELIYQNSLYKGEEWKNVLIKFLEYKINYESLTTDTEKEVYAWEQSVKAGDIVGRIRNHSMGVLLTDISNGMDLDDAVRKYERIVAPENYKRPKPIFTKKMLEEAQKTIRELGYMDSLDRRFATLDDITINNILFSNKDASKRITGADIFDEMMKEVTINPKQFSRVEEVSIDTFINDILPRTSELEVFFENRHSSNMVSLIAPKNKNAKTMFKWNNGFSWAYSGNITDSSMKERVKSAGGNVEGVLRFSIQWNEERYNPNDFDAHCIEPNGNEIYFGSKKNVSTTGELDVDIMHPINGTPAVENITWTNKNKMKVGTYKFYVNNYYHKGGRDGFKAEIEFNGQIYSFEYNKELKHKETVEVAEVTFDGDNFTIKEKLPSSLSSREVWGLNTNQFVPVSVVCYSPNYWDDQNGIGHKHYFFMLKDCVNPEKPNGMYNEFLKEELLKHKRVFEALASKLAVQDSPDQLSGLGFSSTKRNELVVKVKGNTERVIKIKF